MALTVDTNPSAKHAAFNEVLWKVESDRDNAEATAVTGTADSGGFVQFTTAYPHNYEVKDCIIPSGFSHVPNGSRYQVTAKGASTVTINLAYDAAYSGDTGTITRNNTNFQVKMELKNAAGVVQETSYIDADNADKYSKDVSGIIQNQLSDDVDSIGTSQIVTTNSNSYFQYKLTYTEIFDDSNGQSQEADTLNINDLSAEDIIGYNIALQDGESLTDFIMSTSPVGSFLKTFPSIWKVTTAAEIQLSFLTSETAVYCDVARYNSAGAKIDDVRIPAAGTVTVVGGRCILTLAAAIFTSAVNYITVKINNAATTLISETLTLYVDRQGAKDTIIWFKTHLGGFDQYTYKDVIKQNVIQKNSYKTDRIKKTLKVSQYERWKLTGQSEHEDTLLFLRELQESDKHYYFDLSTLEEVYLIPSKYKIETIDLEQPEAEFEIEDRMLNS